MRFRTAVDVPNLPNVKNSVKNAYVVPRGITLFPLPLLLSNCLVVFLNYYIFPAHEHFR